MRRDRVAENIYVFISDIYIQVTCGVLLGDEGAILIDTLPLPSETREVRDFIAAQLGPGNVRYIIYTHSHADHVYGAYLFPEAQIIAHEGCRDVLRRLGKASLQAAKRQTPELAEVELRLPNVTFQGEMRVHFDLWTLRLLHMPGHTADSLVVYVEGEKVLFAGDLVMPVPYVVWGDRRQMKKSLQAIRTLKPDIVVQGHGQVLLRGEARETIATSIAYLDKIYEIVREVVAKDEPPETLTRFNVESCGKSRIPLNGMVERLHQDNLNALYNRLKGKRAT